MPEDLNYCQRCGHTLSETVLEGTIRPNCPSCGYVVFLDPKVVAVVVVYSDDGMLLVRRDIEPARGRWSFPSGYVDRGESIEAAAQREVVEETGLDVEASELIGVYSATGEMVAIIAYSAEIKGGVLEAGSEVTDAKFFPLHKLPELPFPHDNQILADWNSKRKI